MVFFVYKQILRLNVAMANAHSVDVGNGAHHLVGVEFDEQFGHVLLFLVEVAHDAVNGLGHEVHHDVQVHLVALARGEEVVLHFYHVRVVQFLHDLQLAVLEALVLEHFLDRHDFARLLHLGLVHNAERPVSHDLLSIVSESLLKDKTSFTIYLRFPPVCWALPLSPASVVCDIKSG